jgi:hypothetical protein
MWPLVFPDALLERMSLRQLWHISMHSREIHFSVLDFLIRKGPHAPCNLRRGGVLHPSLSSTEYCQSYDGPLE